MMWFLGWRREWRKDMKRKITILILLLVAIIFVIVYLQYNKPHRSVDDEKAITVTAVALYRAFYSDESQANQQYLDKAVEVTGVVDQISTNQEGKFVVVLRSENPIAGIACTLETSLSKIQTGDKVTVKGICTGYLQDVVITNARVTTSVNKD